MRPLTPRTIVRRGAFERELAGIRESGFEVDDEEFMDGSACVAAAAHRGEDVVGVYSVAAPVERFRVNRNRLLRATRSAARLAEVYSAQAAGEARTSARASRTRTPLNLGLPPMATPP